MYAYLSEVILVQDHKRRHAGDPTMYTPRHPITGECILTHDSKAPEAKPYGTSYYDHRETLCIIPHAWSDVDARQAKDVLM